MTSAMFKDKKVKIEKKKFNKNREKKKQIDSEKNLVACVMWFARFD